MHKKHKSLITGFGLLVLFLAILIYLLFLHPENVIIENYHSKETPLLEKGYKPLRGLWRLENGILDQYGYNPAKVKTIIPFFRYYVPPAYECLPNAHLIVTSQDKSNEFQCQFMAYRGKEGAMIIFGYNENEFYTWNIGGRNNTITRIEHWKLNDTVYEPFAMKPYSITHNKWYRARFLMESDNRVTGYIDDSLVIQAQLGSSLHGNFGVGTWDTQVKFKDIVVVPPDN